MLFKVAWVQTAALLVCTGLFAGQSYKEIMKFFTKLTSTAIRTYREDSLVHPDIVVCHDKPFDSDKQIITKEEFERHSKTAEDTFFLDGFMPPLNTSLVSVESVYTIWVGRCFLVRIAPSVDFSQWIGLAIRNMSGVHISLLSRHQEVCVKISMCPSAYPTFNFARDIAEFWLFAQKRVYPKKKCKSDPGYNQYACLNEKLQERMRNLSCTLPSFQLEPDPLMPPPCTKPEDIKEILNGAIYGLDDLMHRPAEAGCPSACEEWAYKYEKREFYADSMVNLLGTKDAITIANVWVTFVSPTVEVIEEYIVYDFSGITASVGGSLGLFLGFSFYDCFSFFFKRRCEDGKKEDEKEGNKEEDAEGDNETRLVKSS